jgi:RHS repeat-associated protein
VANKSGTSSGAVPLPKGGGAIQGIGEQFAPDPFTGGGKFSVPIGLPSGRGRLQPRLSLDYATTNGAGPFGLGWALSLPGVSRKTNKGIPRYRDESADPHERDVFLLSGAEDLVAVEALPDGVTRYRPRTEGLFARIDHVRGTGRDEWRVTSRDGLVSRYGLPDPVTADPAVLADPSSPDHIFAWKLVETIDPHGNRIEYRYRRDRQASGSRQWDQLYLDEIAYADFEEGGETKFLVTVRFLYEERPDPFSDCRAGFELRTRERCTRIEVRTHAGQDRLQRSYEFEYLDARVAAGELPASELPPNGLSLLSRVRIVGHDGDRTEALPPLEFGYTKFTPQQQNFQPLEASDGAMPPVSLANEDFEMVSLFGNGLPDVVQLNGVARFWRNLGGGQYDAAAPLSEIPSGIHLRDPGVQLADMNGDGRADLLVLERNGYFPQKFFGRWSADGFVEYEHSPAVNFADAELRLLDVDGDGVVDALRTGVDLELFINDPDRGWEPPALIQRSTIDDFPNLNFSDPHVKLADMNGDNLQDLVFVQQGRIDYWPYLGHGRWGGRGTMTGSPTFQDAVPLPNGGFDPRRVLFGDLDGDGLDDLVYVEPGRMTFWINQGGNGWSAPIVIDGTPDFPEADAVRLADVYGTGFQGILWTADQLGLSSAYQFLELTGRVKPYVMETIDNHRGALTRTEYTSSTEFYRADFADPATRWKSPLPVPVQVVKRIESIDLISGSKLTSEFRYHHGYWDGLERELRGFGMVEQLDTVGQDDYNAADLHGDAVAFNTVAPTYFSAPMMTRTWFHLGDAGEDPNQRGEIDFSEEYWAGDLSLLARPAETSALLTTLPGRDRALALRALRGSTLRSELYALDGSDRADRPFTVTECQYGLREVDPPAAGSDRKRLFFPHVVAQRSSQWDRGDEPLTQLSFLDDHDDYGQSRRRASLAVPRGRDGRVPNPAGAPYLGSVETSGFAQRDEQDHYMVDRVARSATFEIVNDGSMTVLDLYRAIQAGTATLNLLGQAFNYFDGAPFEGLPIGQLGARGALVRSETLAMTEAQLAEAYRDPAAEIPSYLQPGAAAAWPADYPQGFRDAMPALAGFRFADGSDHRARGYFVQSAAVAFDFQTAGLPGRGLAIAARDGLGAETRTTYDQPFHLLPVSTIDPVGLRSDAIYDHRLLQPRMTIDSNGNRKSITYSPLGLIAEIFTMGKDGEAVGDTPDAPGHFFNYDLNAWHERGQPVSTRTSIRRHHATDTAIPLPDRDDVIVTVEYTDGFDRLIQTRNLAEDELFGEAEFGGGVLPLDLAIAPGPVASRRRGSGEPVNVVVTGWQLFDNKGRVVEKYEPFFATSFDYTPPTDQQRGQKAVLTYDPMGRVVLTSFPDGSRQRVVYGVPDEPANPDNFAPSPWETWSYDANDLAASSRHPSLTAPDGSPLSLGDRADAAHHGTPSSFEGDALGRVILAVSRNRRPAEAPSQPLPPVEEIRTSTTYDISGRVTSATDGLGRTAFTYVYDCAGHVLRAESIDAGVRHMVVDALGNEVEARSETGALALRGFDILHRPVRLWARDHADAPVTLRQRMAYGDGGDPDQPAAAREAARAANLLGQLVRHHDGAGLASLVAIDFAGNVRERVRRVIADAPLLAAFDNGPVSNWQISPFVADWDAGEGALADRESALLEATEHRSTATFDALGQVLEMTFPEDVEGRRRKMEAHYSRVGGLERVLLDGASFVERIGYDAKGQRSFIAYGNGLMTRYGHDPQSFRLCRLRSEHYTLAADGQFVPSGPPLQDFAYQYDLVGNLVAIFDRTPGCGVLNNAEAASTADQELAQLLASGDAFNRRFDYDAAYRLVRATGRERDMPQASVPWEDQPRGTDLTLARAYSERYAYDGGGNLLQLARRSGADAFTRHFVVDPASNRLRQLTSGAQDIAYAHDANGNLLSEGTSRHFDWGCGDQLKAFRTQTPGAEPSVHAQYLYDAGGQRVKKLVRKQGGQVEVTHYLDGLFEHHRWSGTGGTGENNILHVMDDGQRIALVRVGTAHHLGPAVQYNLGDHLGSSHVVADAAGALINREEYTPYGETSFGNFARKRYRFNGKERDEESGLAYHGARYYAPGLGRWMSCDPAGAGSGLNMYAYALNNPVCMVDPDGRDPVGLPQDEEGNYLLPDETIEIVDSKPQPDDLDIANRNGIADTMNRVEYERRIAWEDKSDPYQLRKSVEYWSQHPDEWEDAWDQRVTREYLDYRAKEAADLQKSYRLMDGYGKIGNGIGWVTVGVIAVATGGELLVAASESAAAYSIGSTVTTSVGKLMAVEFAYGLAAPPGAPDLFPGPGPDDAGRGISTFFAKMLGGGGGGTRRRPFDIPSWGKIAVDWVHIFDRHMHTGATAIRQLEKTRFPINMSERAIKSAIKEAWGNAQKVGFDDQSGIKLIGTGGGMQIEMWFNTATNTITTAYQKL